jgi:hypothetical protein
VVVQDGIVGAGKVGQKSVKIKRDRLESYVLEPMDTSKGHGEARQ